MSEPYYPEKHKPRDCDDGQCRDCQEIPDHDCKQDGEHGCEVCAEWWGQEKTKWVDYPRPEDVHSMIQPQED